jgi:hypothetical protein
MGGYDIWDRDDSTNANAHLFCQDTLKAHAAHASTHHNNKRLLSF